MKYQKERQMLNHELQERLEVWSCHYQVELSPLISARVLTVAVQCATPTAPVVEGESATVAGNKQSDSWIAYNRSQLPSLRLA